MQQAIKKAIEGGYKYKSGDGWTVRVCDPLFWQALGKALGWKEGEIKICGGCGVVCEDDEITAWGKHKGKYNGQKFTGCDSGIEYHHYGQWGIEWHKFVDHLAEGKEPEEFFTQLLNK